MRLVVLSKKEMSKQVWEYLDTLFSLDHPIKEGVRTPFYRTEPFWRFRKSFIVMTLGKEESLFRKLYWLRLTVKEQSKILNQTYEPKHAEDF